MRNALSFLVIIALVVGISPAKDPVVTSTLRAHMRPIHCVAVSSDGKLIASGDAYADKAGVVVLWDMSSSKVRYKLRGHTDGVLDVAFSPDAKMLVSVGADKNLRLWDTASGKQLILIDNFTENPSRVYFLEKSIIAVTTLGGPPEVIDLGDLNMVMRQKRFVKIKRPFSISEFSPDGKLLAVGYNPNDPDTPRRNGELRIFEVKSEKERAYFSGRNNKILSLAFSPNGKLLAAGSADGRIRIWRGTNDNCTTFQGHKEEVTALVFSPDGNILASAGYDGTVKLWDTNAKNKEINDSSISGHTDAIFGLAFTPDGKTVVTGSLDKTIKLWRIRK